MKPLAGRDGLRDSRRAWQDLRWLLPFAAVFLFMPPILGLFDHPLYFFGIPLLMFYLFAVWLIGILLTALVAQRLREDQPPGKDG